MKKIKEDLYKGAEICKDTAIEASGWEWLETYSVDFLRTTPTIIVVTSDPRKPGEKKTVFID